jgi:hypothetical protein
MASEIQIFSSPCSMVQRSLDEKQKFMENLKLSQKVPANVLLINPYETYKSYFDKNQKQLDDLKNKYNADNCTSDKDTKSYNRQKCLTLNSSINLYINQIASDSKESLNSTTDNLFNINSLTASKLKEALNKAKLDFINYNCVAEVEASRQEVVGSIASEFSAYDKKRIEAESIYERNKRVFIGGVILIFGLGLIMTFKKSKK